MGLIAFLIRTIPQYLVNWLYPRVLKPMVQSFEAGGLITARIIGEDLVNSFTDVAAAIDPEGPEYAFRRIIMTSLAAYNIAITDEEIAELLVVLGHKILNDPDFPEVVTPENSSN